MYARGSLYETKVYAVSVHLKIITKHTARSGLSLAFYKASCFNIEFLINLYSMSISVINTTHHEESNGPSLNTLTFLHILIIWRAFALLVSPHFSHL